MNKEQIIEEQIVSPLSGLKAIMDDDFGFYHPYSGKKFYCKVCGNKSVYMNRQQFQNRDEYIKTSKSQKSDSEKKQFYNKKHKLKESDFWKCQHSLCDLYVDDERINNVNVFKLKSLIKDYRKPNPNRSQWW